MEVIKASNNFSQRSFEYALRTGALANLNVGSGSILRGLAGEAVMLQALRTIAPASPQPSALSGVLPDIVQLLPSGIIRVPFGEIHHHWSLTHVLTGSGGTTGNVDLGVKNQFVLFEVKSGFSERSIPDGVTQVVATAAALKTANQVGTSVLVVDEAAWGKLSSAKQNEYFTSITKAGGYIQTQPGLADAAAERAKAAVDDASKLLP